MKLWYALALGIVIGAGPAQGQDLLPPEKVKELIASRYGVEVLRVAAVDGEGSSVTYRVTVMVPPGDSNAAFMVSTLVVDATTGDLVPQFRHLRHGYQLPPAGASARENSSVTSRRETFRPHF
ncbi:MAG: hypothetical protein L0210_01010 [Rhodospirillales bacterium]|nr:hypothetical protein [Rhodospirillales bacterium]